MYKWIINEFDLIVVMLVGNYDFEINDLVYSVNVVVLLSFIGVVIVCGKCLYLIKIGDVIVYLISWCNNYVEFISDLKVLCKSVEGDNYDVVIYIFINKVILIMFDVGIDVQELKDIGFCFVFSGYYYNYKEVISGVISVGVLIY